MTGRGFKKVLGGARSAGFAMAGLALASASPALADWQDEIGTLRIGMVSPSGGRGVAGLKQMTAAFERAAGIPAEILVARDYPSLIRAISQQRVHYAILSATAYAVTDAYCGCVEPVAAPRGVDGVVGMRAVVIARSGTYDDLQQWSGARLVAGPADDLGPQVLALAAVNEAGVPGRAGTIVHAPSHGEAEASFAVGDADVLVGWEPAHAAQWTEVRSGSLARLKAAGVNGDDLKVIWSSGTLTYGPHVVRSELPDELKDRLGRFLISLHEQQPEIYELLEPYRGGGFSVVDGEDYAVARQIADGFASR